MRNKVIIAAVVLVGLASVAYAAFAQLLTINGTGTATADWNVEITGITRTSATGATDVAGTPSFTATSAIFNTDLAYPGATATYGVTIKNNGTISAKLSTITDLATINAAAPADITYSMSGVAVNDVLAPGASVTVSVSVTWAASATTIPSPASKSATIDFNYVQN